MQRLTAMTLGAAFLGVCGFIYDANAQTPEARVACPAYDVTVYFAPGSAELNDYAAASVALVAKTASACGARGVALQAPGGAERADSVAKALRARGVPTFVAPAGGLTPISDGIAARTVTLRVVSSGAANS